MRQDAPSKLNFLLRGVCSPGSHEESLRGWSRDFLAVRVKVPLSQCLFRDRFRLIGSLDFDVAPIYRQVFVAVRKKQCRLALPILCGIGSGEDAKNCNCLSF